MRKSVAQIATMPPMIASLWLLLAGGSVGRLRDRPLLANGVEQCFVNADLPVSDEVEFIADVLFPIGDADKPRLDN